MKRFTLLIINLLIIFCSCKKDQPAQQQNNIPGTWNGTCTNTAEIPVIELKFQLNENGQLTALSKDGQTTAEGKWSLEGTQFNAVYQDVPMKMIVYSVSGYYDAPSGKISGMFTSSVSSQVIQYFTLTKE